MKILITEGHKKAYYILEAFSQQKHKLVAINQDKDYCKQLARDFPNAIIVHGDATKPFLLEDAKIYEFDLSIHLSPEDKTNLVTAITLKEQFKVKRAVSIINDSQNTLVFNELGIESTIDTAKVIASIVEQHAFIEKLKSYAPLEDENLVILNLEVSLNTTVIGKKIQTLDLPEEAIVTAIFRSKKPIIPKGNTMIEAGDRIIVTTLKRVQNKVIKVLTT
ncbi:MAG: NAD-binding protein [Candidatus Izemoplasmataceae bacterium]